MNHALSLFDVLDADRPACSEDLVYRYEPGKGFWRSCTIRFAPAWLTVPWPAQADLAWQHTGSCECPWCQATEALPMMEAPEAVARAEEELLVAS
jgi:hypothetical protein